MGTNSPFKASLKEFKSNSYIARVAVRELPELRLQNVLTVKKCLNHVVSDGVATETNQSLKTNQSSTPRINSEVCISFSDLQRGVCPNNSHSDTNPRQLTVVTDCLGRI